MSSAPSTYRPILPGWVSPASSATAMSGTAPMTATTALTSKLKKDGLSRSVSLRARSMAWPKNPKPRGMEANIGVTAGGEDLAAKNSAGGGGGQMGNVV